MNYENIVAAGQMEFPWGSGSPIALYVRNEWNYKTGDESAHTWEFVISTWSGSFKHPADALAFAAALTAAAWSLQELVKPEHKDKLSAAWQARRDAFAIEAADKRAADKAAVEADPCMGTDEATKLLNILEVKARHRGYLGSQNTWVRLRGSETRHLVAAHIKCGGGVMFKHSNGVIARAKLVELLADRYSPDCMETN